MARLLLLFVGIRYVTCGFEDDKTFRGGTKAATRMMHFKQNVCTAYNNAIDIFSFRCAVSLLVCIIVII